MVTRVKNYQKLSRSKKGFLIGKYTLWLGKDHLLYIFSRFGAEDYKRFYFNDIQAIITRKTLAGKLQNIILGCFILMFLVPVFFFDGGWSIFFGAVSGMMSLFLVFNLYKGPTCDTKLLTAVQTEKLYSLNRLKTACRVMDRLQPYIQLAQGTLKPEDLNKIPLRPVDRSAPKGSGAKSGPPEAAAGFEKGRVHMILFGLLIFDGLLAAMEFFITHVVPTVLSSVAGLCVGICVIIALVKQYNGNLSGSLRAITWTCLGLVCVNFAVGYVVGIVFAMKNPSIAYNQWEVIKSISNLSPWESPLKMSHNIMVICGALFLGGPGLILLRRENKQVKNPAAIRSAMFKRAIISRTPETG
jgi:hypothetical protein